MSPRWLCVVGCGLALTPVGCFWFNRTPVAQAVVALSSGVGTPDTGAEVAFDTKLLEQPVGEVFLDSRVWRETSDPLPHQLTALLAANGLRVGVIAGGRTWELARLADQGCTTVAPTRRRTSAGKPKTIPVNGPLDRCTADVTPALTDDPRKFDMTAVECGLVATATLRPSGKVAVRCEFHLQHGEKRVLWTPTSDGGFDRAEGRTPEAFPTLTFDVELDPDDTLVVGPTRATEGTLGAAFFFTADGSKQRVLVVKVASGSAGK